MLWTESMRALSNKKRSRLYLIATVFPHLCRHFNYNYNVTIDQSIKTRRQTLTLTFWSGMALRYSRIMNLLVTMVMDDEEQNKDKQKNRKHTIEKQNENYPTTPRAIQFNATWQYCNRIVGFGSTHSRLQTHYMTTDWRDKERDRERERQKEIGHLHI